MSGVGMKQGPMLPKAENIPEAEAKALCEESNAEMSEPIINNPIQAKNKAEMR